MIWYILWFISAPLFLIYGFVNAWIKHKQNPIDRLNQVIEETSKEYSLKITIEALFLLAIVPLLGWIVYFTDTDD